MKSTKIKVIRQGEYSIGFEMISDDLPVNGDYHLVPVGKEHIFCAEIENAKIVEMQKLAALHRDYIRERQSIKAEVIKLKFETDLRMKEIEQKLKDIQK